MRKIAVINMKGGVAGWVYRSEAAPPAHASRPRGFFAAARDALTLPMELMLSIVLAACPTRRR